MYSNTRNSLITILLLVLLFLVMVVSLFKLQILRGKEYSSIADKNFVRIKNIQPVRGEIYDRNYRPIAVNKPSNNLYISPGKILNREDVAEFVSENFEVELEEIRKIIHNNRFRLHNNVLLIQDVNYEKVVEISEQLNYYPSLSFISENLREYMYNNHFTGYVGKINDKELEKLKPVGYFNNSKLGKNGLEKYYEKRLRGDNGYEVIQVDASGKSLEFFKYNLNKNPHNGANLILTIDNDLQSYITEIFPEDLKGSMVVMDVKTGGILAYISQPEYDQNLFVNKLSSKDWNRLMNDPAKPMLDRVIHSSYPPGSVYKPIIATLGLENELITTKSKMSSCDGGMMIGNRYFKCWWPNGHGKLNVIDALKVSCDVFFYDLSLQLTLEEIQDFTANNHLTRKTGVDLFGERNGFFPTLAWYRENYGKYVGIIGPKVNISIGQGELLTTPLQIGCYYNALANNGVWVQPHLLSKTIYEDRTEDYEPIREKLPVSQKNLDIIHDALYKVVNAQYGTGSSTRLAGAKVYGKSGSAENHMGKLTHSWMAGYVAWDAEPEISYVVFVENGGHGGSVAGPIAAKMLKFYDTLRIEEK